VITWCLNQFGGLFRGPNQEEQVFFFVHMEALQYRSLIRATGTVLTTQRLPRVSFLLNRDSSNIVRSVNLLTNWARRQWNSFHRGYDYRQDSWLRLILTSAAPGLEEPHRSNSRLLTDTISIFPGQRWDGNYRRFPRSFRLERNTENHIGVV